ncbi:hypothetical protein KA005_16695 [bacterium]|nr:hypothetical protein [bacterium]
MNEIQTMLDNAPRYLILEDKVYQLSISFAQNSDRGFHRGLVDFRVEGVNPLNPSDKWRTLLGMSEELYADYPGFRIKEPLIWILIRFLSHHVRSNSIEILKGPNGQVLLTGNFRDFLGSVGSDDIADEMLPTVLSSWARAALGNSVELASLFVSTDIKLDTLKRSLNSLAFQEQIEEVSANNYKVKPSIFDKNSRNRSVSMDRRSNRYYQEISIQAKEPFCFVIMPFREKEFEQSIYFDVIKPFIEEQFKIACYRVDEDSRPDRIDNKIYSYILRAAFIVSEVTTRNPNVLYELGLAHMLEKDCIILTQTPNSEVPFDINRISAEPYENQDQLRAYLGKSISALAFKAVR